MEVKPKYSRVKTIIKLLNRPPENETARQRGIAKINKITNYSVNSYVKRPTDFLITIAHNDSKRRAIQIQNIALCEQTENYIIAEDKNLNDNIALLENQNINFQNHQTLYKDRSKIINTEISVASGMHDTKTKVAIDWKLNPKRRSSRFRVICHTLNIII